MAILLGVKYGWMGMDNVRYVVEIEGIKLFKSSCSILQSQFILMA